MKYKMHSFETNNTTVPAFLIKLWKLVEDPLCNDLIAWSDSGSSFIIKDQIRFSKELLPQYFKHNNMASFIRQLNMYGFRKVMNYEKTGLRNENDEMEFQHTFFSKGQSGLLAHIKRKIPNTKVSEPTVKSNARDILTDLTSIREKQENMDNMLLKMKQENELLWRELTNMRKKHKAQEHVIQKVIQFLVSIVQRSNQNISVPRKIPRMLYDSSENQENSQVSGTVDVLRKKNPNIITVSEDKIVSPLGPVIHEVTDADHDPLENQLSLPLVKSPEDHTENNVQNAEGENHENACPLENSSLNSPINVSTNMEPLSILEPLQANNPVLNSDDGTVEESVLGIPLEYIADSPCNVISIPDEESSSKVISLPAINNSDSDVSYSISSTPGLLVYTTSKSDYDDLLSESLNTPKIPTIHIEDLYVPDIDTGKKDNETHKEDKASKIKAEKQQQEQQQNEHNYQLAISDSNNTLKSSSLAKNSLSNHLLNVEEELNWLQDQISCGTWNIDPNKLLGLFSTDDVANNEALAEEIADEITVKTEPVDIVGNELVQFTPSMLEVDLDLGNNQFLQCLNQDEVVSVSDINKNSEDQKNFLTDVLKTDQAAASEAAEYFLSNGAAAKQKSPRRPKFQKLQKAKRRKLK